MKWVISGLLILIGLGVISEHPFVGLTCILIGGGVIAASVMTRTKSQPVRPYRPQAAPTAKVEAEEERRRAKKKARKIVEKAESAAHAEGRAAIAEAERFLASEPRWV